MTSVTFPPHLGGSGITISDDADPKTGLLNSGHERLFVPGLQGVVDMASYVARYAQAIDRAKANADQAENARGFVQAVADEYDVNIREQYARRSTYRLNFAEGFYKVDDGDANAAVQAGEAMSLDRSSPKAALTAGGMLKSAGLNTLARQWDLSTCKYAASIEQRRSNLLSWSEDFSKNAWSKIDVGVTATGVQCRAIGVPFYRLHASIGGTTDRRLRQTVQVYGGRFYTSTVYVRPEKTEYLMVFLAGAFTSSNNGTGYRIVFNLNTLEMRNFSAWTGPNVTKAEAIRLPDGTVKICVTAECFHDAVTPGAMQIILKDDFSNGTFSTLSEGEGLLIAAGMTEEAKAPGSYIRTAESSVSRTDDQLKHRFDGEFNALAGTLFVEYRRPYAISRANILKIGPQNDVPYVGLGVVSTSGGRYGELVLRDGTTSGLTLTMGILDDTDRVQKIALSWDRESVSAAVGGDQRVNRVEVPDGFDFQAALQTLTLGRSRLLSGDESTAEISEGSYFDLFYMPIKLTGPELVEVTRA